MLSKSVLHGLAIRTRSRQRRQVGEQTPRPEGLLGPGPRCASVRDPGPVSWPLRAPA